MTGGIVQSYRLDAALLAARLMTGAFLIDGVWDNIVSADRMREFETFLAAHHYPAPTIAAPATVWAQFAMGVALVAGVFVRVAGAALAAMFVVAVATVHLGQSLREIWPAAALIALGLIFAAGGGGRFTLPIPHLRRGAAR